MTKRVPTGLSLVAMLFTALAVVGESHGSVPLTASPGEADRTVAIEARCPTFSWGLFEGASAFRLVVYTVAEDGEAKGRSVLERTLSSAFLSWTPSEGQCLSPGRYAWAVRAETAEGWSEWSKPRLFEVRAHDVTPEMRQAAEQVLGQWLAEARISAVEAAALREAPLVPPLTSSATIRPPEPANFTPIPCQAGSEVFSDVPATHPFCSWIQQLVRDKITAGCATNPLRYCPDAAVTRGQMAVFLERALHLRDPEVEAGDLHTCGLLSNRSVVCWGDQAAGKSTPPAGTFTQVSGGEQSHVRCDERRDGGLLGD